MQRKIRFNNGQINYEVSGEGEAVVLIHGFMEDHRIWEDFIRELSGSYKVIAVDLPGHGGSSVFSEIHTMPFMASAVQAVLVEEDVSTCIMVGHSMGGYVTMAFADKFQNMLRGIVLFHSHAASDSATGRENRERAIKIVRGDHGNFIHNFIPTMFCEDQADQYEKEIAVLRERSMQMPVEGIVAAIAGMRDRKDLKELLSTMNIPVFFIVGKKDSKISMEMIMEQLPLPANSEALIIDNVGHMGFIEARDLTLKSLHHFIARNI